MHCFDLLLTHSQYLDRGFRNLLYYLEQEGQLRIEGKEILSSDKIIVHVWNCTKEGDEDIDFAMEKESKRSRF